MGREKAPRKTAAKGSTRRAAGGASAARADVGRRGDRIVIDTPTLGSGPREGEVVRVIEGEVSVSYEVEWPDGRRSVITPAAGVARFVKS